MLKRMSSVPDNSWLDPSRIEDVLADCRSGDPGRVRDILTKCKPTEIYNLGAQSHVRVSFDIPEYTGDVVGLGALRILEAVHEAGLVRKVRFY